MLSTVITAVLLASAAAQMVQHCFPSNDTLTKCFQGMTPLPTPLADNVTIGGITSFDGMRYVTSTFMPSPAAFCEHKDHWAMIFDCVDTATTGQCPSMPQEMRLNSDKTRSALNNLCSNTNAMNMGCMQNHSRLAMECGNNVIRTMRTGMGMDMMMGTPPPPGLMNTSTQPRMREDHVCFFKFLMMTCVQRNMTACHLGTGDAIANGMRGMVSSPACENNMNTWKTAAQQGGCVGPDCPASGGMGLSASAALVVTTTATLAGVSVWLARAMG